MRTKARYASNRGTRDSTSNSHHERPTERRSIVRARRRRRRADGDPQVVRRQRGALRRRPDRAHRRARRDLRPVRLGQVDAAAHDQPAEPTDRRLRQGHGVEYGPGPGRPSAASRSSCGAHVGMVFQQFNLFPHLTALDNITLPLRAGAGASSAPRPRSARRTRCSSVGLLRWAAPLPARAVRRPAAAGRDRARAGLDPKVMLFDEPTSALDPELVGEVLARDAQGRRDRHDDGDRHPRARVRARDRRPQRLHGGRA